MECIGAIKGHLPLVEYRVVSSSRIAINEHHVLIGIPGGVQQFLVIRTKRYKINVLEMITFCRTRFNNKSFRFVFYSIGKATIVGTECGNGLQHVTELSA